MSDMSQLFEFESGIDDYLSTFNTSLVNGPAARWQRKAFESRVRSGGVPLSPCNVNRLTQTPIRTPRRCITPLKTPKKTPQKTPSKATPLVDRFIPNRATMDNDKNYFQLVNIFEPEIKFDQELCPEDLEKNYFHKTMKDNLENTSESRILHLKQRPPAGYHNDRVIYCQDNVSSNKRKITRYITRDAYKILDAPDMVDDFYLNLVDWGSKDCVAIGLLAEVFIWNNTTCVSERLLETGGDSYVCSLSWIKEGNVLAVGCCDGYVQLWDVERGKRLRTMGGHDASVGSLSWNSYVLSSGCHSGMIYNHDVRVQNHLISTVRLHMDDVCGLRWSPDGKLLASGANDNLVRISSPLAAGGIPLHTLAHTSAVKALSWCPWEPNVLATGAGSTDRHVRFFNSTTGSCINTIDTKSQISSIMWSKEHKELITAHGFAKNQLSIWKYPSMLRIADLLGHERRVLHASMSPCGEYVASAGADETMRIWKCFEHNQMKRKSPAPLQGKSRNFSMISNIR